MKRYVLVWILLLVLVLTACVPALQPDPTNAAQPTESAVTPTLPTSPPAKPDSEQLQAYYAWQETRRGEDFLVFRYDGTLPNSVKGAVDATNLTVGYLYVFDFVLEKIVPVAEGPCTEAYDYNHYWGNVYYVPENYPSRVCVATYNRELGEIVGTYSPYVSNGSNITALQHYGTNQDDGKLLICEEGRGIISYDMRIDDTEVLMEAYSIEEFSYSPSSLYSDSFAENVSSDEMGDVICWRGKLTEQDTVSTYYYIVQKDEHWAEKDWTVVPAEPKAARPNSYGYPFIFDGSNPSMQDDADISECVKGYVYWYNVDDKNIFFVTDKAVVDMAGSETHAYFVTEEEPTKIYAAPLEDFSKQEVIYESTHGKIDSIITGWYQYTNTVLQITEGSSRFVWFDLTQNKAELFMEQYFLLRASIETSHHTAQDEDGDWYLVDLNQIFFFGKLSENDTEIKSYHYFRDTGEVVEFNYT